MRQPVGKQSANTLIDVCRRRDFLVEPLHRFASSGLSFNFTKVDLYDYFRSAPADMTLDAASIANEKFVGDWQQLVNKLTDLASNVFSVYANALKLLIPPADDNTVASLWLVEYGRKLAKTNTTLAEYVDMMTANGTLRQTGPGLRGMVSTLYSDYVDALQDVQVILLK
jgi:hypothetical protein